jgi:hypothetical protein
MGFEERFTKANTKIAASSVQTYIRNLKRLARLGGLDSVPDHSRWLNKKLLAKTKQQKLNTRKILAAAAVKVFRLYKKEPGQWSSLMYEATKEYNQMREKRQKTTREKAVWPSGGYKSLWKAAMGLAQEAPDKPSTLKGLRQLQDAWLMSFYATHTPRLIAGVRIDGSGPNVLKRRGKQGWTMVLGQHKASKAVGASTIKLDKRLNGITSDFVAALRGLKKPFLLVNARGEQMSRSSLSKRLVAITKQVGLAGFSAQILRVLKSTSNIESINKAQTLENEMGHGARESRRYAKK